MVIRAPTRTRKRLLSIAEFLALPETKPASELIDGEVVQKPMPTIDHNVPIRTLARALDRHAATVGGDWLTEQGVDFPRAARANHRVPDLSWFEPGRLTGIHSYPDFPPDLAVEVRSPGQTRQSQQAKLAFYREWGSKATLLVDPIQRDVELHDGDRVEVASTGTLTIEAIGGFTFDVASLFLGPE